MNDKNLELVEKKEDMKKPIKNSRSKLKILER